MLRGFGWPAAAVLPWLVALSARSAVALPFQPHPLPDETYTEQFSAQAVLDDGTFLHLQVGFSNVGIGDGKAACRIVAVSPSGRVWTKDEKYGPDDWRFVAEPFPQLQVGPCFFRGGFVVEVHMEVAGAIVRATLEAEVTPVHPPCGRVDVDGDFYESEILIPWAPARVELTLPGEKKRLAHGTGYLDHSRSTAMPYESARRWVRFRVLAEKGLLFLARVPPGKGVTRGWLWRRGEPAPSSVLRVALRPTGSLWSAEFDTAEGTFQVIGKKMLYRHAPVEEIGFGAALVRRIVGDPVTTVMRGELVGPGITVPLVGVMEVSDHKR